MSNLFVLQVGDPKPREIKGLAQVTQGSSLHLSVSPGRAARLGWGGVEVSIDVLWGSCVAYILKTTCQSLPSISQQSAFLGQLLCFGLFSGCLGSALSFTPGHLCDYGQVRVTFSNSGLHICKTGLLIA